MGRGTPYPHVLPPSASRSQRLQRFDSTHRVTSVLPAFGLTSDLRDKDLEFTNNREYTLVLR